MANNNIDDRIKSLTTNTTALATDLVALLDRFIFLEGCTLNAHPVQPEDILPPLPDDNIPIAVQMYATPSLSDHLDAHDAELQESTHLSTRIATLTALPSVRLATDKILDREFAALLKPQKLKFSSLTAKLATLRNLQQHLTQPPRPQEFKTYIVTAVNDTGSADPFTIIHLPVTASWLDYAEILTQHTQHWKTTADGFPDGYTVKGGKWFYQRIVKGRREEKFCELGCENEFRGMRRELRREGIGVLVWHARTLAASRAAKDLRNRQAESDEMAVDLSGVDFEYSGVDFEKFFEQEEGADEHSVGLWTGEARCDV